MLNRLISLNRYHNKDFIKHIELTKNLCLYKLGNHYIPKNIFFPNATSLTLINCESKGISDIVCPQIFPNLNTINYLSKGNKYNDIHEKFNKQIEWNFPDKNYEYYNYMMEAGYGKKDSSLINKYMLNKKIIDGKNGFDISYEFDLNIPYYGIVNGEWWRSQFYEYLVKKQNSVLKNTANEIQQEYEEANLEKEIVAQKLSNYNFDDILIEHLQK